MIINYLKEMKFEFEVDTGNGGYSRSIDTIPKLLNYVSLGYGIKEVEKVYKWLETAKENDEYVSDDGSMHIYCLSVPQLCDLHSLSIDEDTMNDLLYLSSIYKIDIENLFKFIIRKERLEIDRR